LSTYRAGFSTFYVLTEPHPFAQQNHLSSFVIPRLSQFFNLCPLYMARYILRVNLSLSWDKEAKEEQRWNKTRPRRVT